MPHALIDYISLQNQFISHNTENHKINETNQLTLKQVTQRHPAAQKYIDDIYNEEKDYTDLSKVYRDTEGMDYCYRYGPEKIIRVSDIVRKVAELKPEENIELLDIGAGYGCIINELKNCCPEIPLDITLLNGSPFDFAHKAYNVVGDAQNMHKIAALENKTFDIIVTRLCLLHLPDPFSVILHAYERLKPGGILLTDGFGERTLSRLDYDFIFANLQRQGHAVAIYYYNTLPHQVYSFAIRKAENTLSFPIKYGSQNSELCYRCLRSAHEDNKPTLQSEISYPVRQYHN